MRHLNFIYFFLFFYNGKTLLIIKSQHKMNKDGQNINNIAKDIVYRWNTKKKKKIHLVHQNINKDTSQRMTTKKKKKTDHQSHTIAETKVSTTPQTPLWIYKQVPNTYAATRTKNFIKNDLNHIIAPHILFPQLSLNKHPNNHIRTLTQIPPPLDLQFAEEDTKSISNNFSLEIDPSLEANAIDPPNSINK